MNKKYLTVFSILLSFVVLPALAGESFMQKLSNFNIFDYNKDVTVADNIPIQIINDPKSPIKITSADVQDKGTSLLKIKNLEQTFTTKAFNNGRSKIMAYQLVWERHLPFEDYAEQDMRINNINAVKPGDSDVLEFRKPIYYRKDAYYTVFVAKVLLEDGTEWKSDRDFDVGGYWADIKKEIDGMGANSGNGATAKSSLLDQKLEHNSNQAQ